MKDSLRDIIFKGGSHFVQYARLPLDIILVECRNIGVNMSNLNPVQLRRAASIIEKLERLQKELNQLLGAESAPGIKPGGKLRKFSAAGIARIRAAQKARWAKVHAAQGK